MLLHQKKTESFYYGLNKIISSNISRYKNNYKNDEIMNIIVDLKNIDILVKSTTLNHENLISILIIKICQGYYG